MGYNESKPGPVPGFFVFFIRKIRAIVMQLEAYGAELPTRGLNLPPHRVHITD